MANLHLLYHEDSPPNGSIAADIVVGAVDVWVHLVAY